MEGKELISDKPTNPRSIMVAEMDHTLWIMFEAIDWATVKKKEPMSQVDVILYVEFLLKNGLAFESKEDLNEYEEEFFTELAESYRLGMYN